MLFRSGVGMRAEAGEQGLSVVAGLIEGRSRTNHGACFCSHVEKLVDSTSIAVQSWLMNGICPLIESIKGAGAVSRHKIDRSQESVRVKNVIGE